MACSRADLAVSRMPALYAYTRQAGRRLRGHTAHRSSNPSLAIAAASSRALAAIWLRWRAEAAAWEVDLASFLPESQ
jgi:hypothetical protein